MVTGVYAPPQVSVELWVDIWIKCLLIPDPAPLCTPPPSARPSGCTGAQGCRPLPLAGRWRPAPVGASRGVCPGVRHISFLFDSPFVLYPHTADPHICSTQVWCDEQRAKVGDRHFLSIWRPVPPAGYVAVGMVAGLGSLPPPVAVMRCVRADAALSTTLQRQAPSWAHPEFRSVDPHTSPPSHLPNGGPSHLSIA